MNIVFMGSPAFALPSLQALGDHARVVGVVTQPDRPAGRGRSLAPPPVKLLATRLDIPVIQPARLREPQAMAQLRQWQPDVIVVAAFGQILRPEVLDLPSHGCINVHASLLPRWRGAAPIPAAILAGDPETGVTIMQMDPGMDTGAILTQGALPIHPQDTTQSLTERLAALGAGLLIETLPGYLAGHIRPVPQEESLATYAPKLTKASGALDFNRPAEHLARQVRAYTPWPGSFTAWQGRPMKILRAHADPQPSPGPGVPGVCGRQPALGAADGLLVLDEIQLAGRPATSGEAFLRGARGWLG
jgi:methionyl-tRNA formyltransferase